jgi:predicted HD superfamily hydrolase involved in NAD metabolism
MLTMEMCDFWARERLSSKRYQHTAGVLKSAQTLADIYHCDQAKIAVAALCHDTAKGMPPAELLSKAEQAGWPLDPVDRMRPALLHGPVAAILCARELDVKDEDILNAIRFHTTGRPGMSLLEQIIYLADLTEEGRDFPGLVSLRERAGSDLQAALIMAFDQTLRWVLERRDLIHPMTIQAWNWYLTHRH